MIIISSRMILGEWLKYLEVRAIDHVGRISLCIISSYRGKQIICLNLNARSIRSTLFVLSIAINLRLIIIIIQFHLDGGPLPFQLNSGYNFHLNFFNGWLFNGSSVQFSRFLYFSKSSSKLSFDISFNSILQESSGSELGIVLHRGNLIAVEQGDTMSHELGFSILEDNFQDFELELEFSVPVLGFALVEL